MSPFALLLLLALLAKISYADKCSAPEDGEDDVTFIADDYVRYVGELPVPMLVYGDHSAGQYIKMINKAFKFYGRSLVQNLYDEAVAAGEQLIDDIERLVEKFEKYIKLMARDDVKRSCSEDILKMIINQLHAFLELKPGNGKFKCPTLPPLPELQIQLKSVKTRRTPKEMFLEFEKTINDASSQVYAYMAFVIKEGWEKLRKNGDYEAVRKVIYKEILNDSVLDSYKLAVETIHKYIHFVRNSVSLGTWKAFEEARKRIIEIADEVDAGNEDEDDSSSAHCSAQSKQ